jgi:hypothetical protein
MSSRESAARGCPRVAAFSARYLYSHHVQDGLLPLKQTVRHLLESRTTFPMCDQFMIRGPKEFCARLVRALPKQDHAHKEPSDSQYRNEDVSPGLLRSVDPSDDAGIGPRLSTRLGLLHPRHVASQPLPIPSIEAPRRTRRVSSEEIHGP